MRTKTLSEADENSILISYLLERLPEAEARGIEERYFADDEFFNRVTGCEQELIRSYLLRNLSGDEVLHFERKYLSSPALREKIELCSAVMKATKPVRDHLRWNIHSRIWLFAPIGATAATLILAVILQIRLSYMEGRLQRVEAHDSHTLSPTMPAREIASFALAPTLDRTSIARAVVLRLTPETAEVRLSLEIESDNRAAKYRAALASPEGSEIWSGFIDGGGSVVTIVAPATNIVRGDYLITLNEVGGRAHQSYSFRIER
jgi:hypothetical protein